MTILVTGAAGFIGMHTTEHLLNCGETVIGIDNINDYYDTKIKHLRLKNLSKYSLFNFYQIDICNYSKINYIFQKYNPKYVVHLAAQAGVRYSLTNPNAYIQSNIVGFSNIIEASKNVERFIYASSSSVYGTNKELPFKETQLCNTPASLYAASKLSNELIAHSYWNNFNLKSIGLRFFTVYGPWGRPDMAIWKFTNAIANEKPVELFNFGEMSRDLTFISDVVDAISKCIFNDIEIKHNLYNIGNSNPISLLEIVNLLEKLMNKRAMIKELPLPKTDVMHTYADISKARNELNYQPLTVPEEGFKKWIDWYFSQSTD